MPYEQIEQRGRQARGLDVIVFLAGIWLIVSPFLFTYESGAILASQVIFGIVVSVLAIVRYFVHEAVWASWLSAVSGLWLIVAPFLIGGASAAAYWSSIIGGLVVLLISVALTSETLEPASRHIHHRPQV